LLFTVFILGFVADPILDLYLGPIDIDVYELEEELNTDSSWIAHLVKGVASLGLLSFIRSIWIFSPFWSPRSGILAGRTTGRDRARSLNWLFIVVGVGTFLWVSTAQHDQAVKTNLLRLFTRVYGLGVDEH
jgi:hypothetical protein